MLMTALGSGFFDTFGMGNLYAAHPYTLDSVLYLILFLGIARVTLGRRYHGRGGRAIVGSVGTMLAVAASISAWRSGFTLGQLGLVAWLILALVLLLVLIDMFGHRESSRARADSDHPYPSCHSVHHTFHEHHQRSETPNPQSDPLHAKTVLEDESAMTRLLTGFIQYIDQHGLDQHAGEFLIQIARTHRRTDRLYKQMLTTLASSGWRADPDKKLLAADVESMIKAMFENNALFIEAMRIAEAAIHGENTTLLKEAITRMHLLEQETIRLVEQLVKLTNRLKRKAQKTQVVDTTRGDGAR